MEIVNTISEGSNSVENHITIEKGNYIHKQIEKRNDKIFMRMKTRRIYETT